MSKKCPQSEKGVRGVGTNTLILALKGEHGTGVKTTTVQKGCSQEYTWWEMEETSSAYLRAESAGMKH